MDEKKVREAIKEFEIEKQTYEDMISYCKHFEPKNDCGRYEEKIAICKTAIKALEKQLPKKPVLKRNAYGGISVCPICGASDYGKYCRQCGQRINWEEEENECTREDFRRDN